MSMTVESLAEELHKRALDRGRSDTQEFSMALSRLIFKYDVDLGFESFEDARGVKLVDEGGRSVSLYPVNLSDGMIRCDSSVYSDVLVMTDGSMVLGWAARDEIREVDDLFVLNSRSLHKMPVDFDFAQDCPHMSVFGGHWVQQHDAWECFGCGTFLMRVPGR